MDLIEIAKNKDKLLQENPRLCCRTCQEFWFSPFDRLFILLKGECSSCWSEHETEEEYIRVANNLVDVL